MNINNFRLLTNNILDDENYQYVKTVLDNIACWKFEEYDSPNIIKPGHPKNSKLSICFNYDSMGRHDDDHAFTIYFDQDDDEFRELNLSFDNFKILLTTIISCQHIQKLNLFIGDYEVIYDQEKLLVDLAFDPIVIPKDSFNSIINVWGQILNFDLEFHMSVPPPDYVDDEDDE
jgi:hypothetical protein